MNESKHKKTMIGKVISEVNQKTCVVEVGYIIHDPIYKKALRRRKKYAAHVDGIDVHIGNEVKIISIAPVSKTKNFKIVEKI